MRGGEGQGLGSDYTARSALRRCIVPHVIPVFHWQKCQLTALCAVSATRCAPHDDICLAYRATVRLRFFDPGDYA